MTYRLMVQKSGSCVAPVGIIYQPCSRKSWKTTRPSSSAIICLTFSWWAIIDLGGGFWQILNVCRYMGVSRLHDIHDMSMTLVETSLNDQFGSSCVLTELTVLLCFLHVPVNAVPSFESNTVFGFWELAKAMIRQKIHVHPDAQCIVYIWVVLGGKCG